MVGVDAIFEKHYLLRPSKLNILEEWLEIKKGWGTGSHDFFFFDSSSEFAS